MQNREMREREKEREMGGSGRREVSSGMAEEQNEWDDTVISVISLRVTAVCEREKNTHLGTTSIDSLCNMAAIKTPMPGVRGTKTNVSVSRAGSNFGILVPKHNKFWSSVMKAPSKNYNCCILLQLHDRFIDDNTKTAPVDTHHLITIQILQHWTIRPKVIF